jgi:heme-degrading monooxygenase HmoA
MPYVLIEHEVADWETFKTVYLDDLERRKRDGSKGGTVYRTVKEPNKLVIVLEWDSVEKAREFAASLELSEAMHWSTSNVGSPRVSVLESTLDTEA